jgi:hypothetical protein
MEICNLAICIPTHNRSEYISKFLECVSNYPLELNKSVHYYFFDSSNTNDTKVIIEKYRKSLNISYIKYQDEVSLSKKTIDCYYVPNEKYIWLTADRRIPTQEGISLCIKIMYQYDIVVFNDFDFIKSKHVYTFLGLKEFNKIEYLFECCFASMGKYGIVILNKENIINKDSSYFIHKYGDNLFSYYALYFDNNITDIKAITIPCNAINELSVKTRHWDKDVISLWGIRLFEFLKLLPSKYDKYKKKVQNDHFRLMGFDQFSVICSYRVKGFLDKDIYEENKKIFMNILGKKNRQIRVISYLPRVIVLFLLVIIKVYDIVTKYLYGRLYRSNL